MSFLCIFWALGQVSCYETTTEKILHREETLTLLCADSSTFQHLSALLDIFFSNLIAFFGTLKTQSHFTCNKSHDTCPMSHVKSYLPPVTNANSHRPSPADSSIIHSRLVQYKKYSYRKNVVKIGVTFKQF